MTDLAHYQDHKATIDAIAQLAAISWWHVIVDLQRHGYTHGAVAAAVGVARGTVDAWKNRNCEPGHVDGERLIALWRVCTGLGRDALPLKTERILSAAAMR